MLNMKTNKLVVLNYLMFILSPLLSLPLILYNIYNRKNKTSSLFLLASFFGVVSYLLLPNWSLDIARYYQRYEEISVMDLTLFLEFMQQTSDYLFYTIFYIFSKTTLSFQFLLLIMTTFNYFIAFNIFDIIISHIEVKSKKSYICLFLLFVISLSFLAYIAASRFTLAMSFFLLSIFNIFFMRKNKRGLLFAILSIFTHISFLLIFLFIFFSFYIKKKQTFFYFFLISVFLLFVFPIEKLITLIPLDNFTEKATIYLDLIRESNWAAVLSHNLVLMFTFVLVLYLLNKKNTNIFEFSPLYMLFIVSILTYPFGFWTYDRFVSILKPVVILSVLIYYIKTKSDFKINSILMLLTVPYTIHFIYAIYLYRVNLAPCIQFKNVFLINILSSTYELTDFL